MVLVDFAVLGDGSFCVEPQVEEGTALHYPVSSNLTSKY